jgi:hypothetical protein
MVVSCPFSQFDGTRFHEPGYVREYRMKLLGYMRSGTRGFGIQFKGQIRDLDVQFVDNQWILASYSIDEVRISTTVLVGEQGEMIQSTILTSRSSRMAYLDYALDLCISVNRASYGQLTEGGPRPIPPSENDFQLLDCGKRWVIINRNLEAMLEGGLFIDETAIDLSSSLSEEVFYGRPANKVFHGRLHLHPWQTSTALCTFKLQSGTTPSSGLSCPQTPPPVLKGHWKLPATELGMIIRRNLEYILGNCMLPVTDTAVCFIADHVALPLGWNRDN